VRFPNYQGLSPAMQLWLMHGPGNWFYVIWRHERDEQLVYRDIK